MEDSLLNSSINEVDERPNTDDLQLVEIESSPDHFPKTKAKVTKYIPMRQKIAGTDENWKCFFLNGAPKCGERETKYNI